MKRSKPNRLQGFKPRGELIKTVNADLSVDETVFDALGLKIKVIHPGNSVVMDSQLTNAFHEGLADSATRQTTSKPKSIPSLHPKLAKEEF